MADIHEGEIRGNGGFYVTPAGAYMYASPTDLSQTTQSPGEDGAAVPLQVDSWGNLRVVPSARNEVAGQPAIQLTASVGGLHVQDRNMRSDMQELLDEIRKLRLAMCVSWNAEYLPPITSVS